MISFKKYSKFENEYTEDNSNNKDKQIMLAIFVRKIKV